MIEITYLSECATDYSQALGACDSLDALRNLLAEWGWLAADAAAVAAAMTEEGG